MLIITLIELSSTMGYTCYVAIHVCVFVCLGFFVGGVRLKWFVPGPGNTHFSPAASQTPGVEYMLCQDDLPQLLLRNLCFSAKQSQPNSCGNRYTEQTQPRCSRPVPWIPLQLSDIDLCSDPEIWCRIHGKNPDINKAKNKFYPRPGEGLGLCLESHPRVYSGWCLHVRCWL